MNLFPIILSRFVEHPLRPWIFQRGTHTHVGSMAVSRAYLPPTAQDQFRTIPAPATTKVRFAVCCPSASAGAYVYSGGACSLFEAPQRSACLRHPAASVQRRLTDRAVCPAPPPSGAVCPAPPWSPSPWRRRTSSRAVVKLCPAGARNGRSCSRARPAAPAGWSSSRGSPISSSGSPPVPPSRVPSPGNSRPGLAGASATKAATTPNASRPSRPRPRPAPRTGCLVEPGCPPEPR